MIGYWICAVSSSSRRVVHDQKWIVTGIIGKRQFPRTKNKVYSWRGPPWTMVRSSVELVYRPQWSHPWTSSMDDNEEWTIQSSIQRTDEQTTLAKLDMTERLINAWLSPKVLGAVDLHQQFPAVEEVISELTGFREPWGSY